MDTNFEELPNDPNSHEQIWEKTTSALYALYKIWALRVDYLLDCFHKHKNNMNRALRNQQLIKLLDDEDEENNKKEKLKQK